MAVVRAGDSPDDFRSYYLGAGTTFFVTWSLSGALALAIGPVVPTSWNLGFAVPVMFLGLLVMSVDTWPKLASVVVAVGVTYASGGLPNRLGLLIGSVAGVVGGVAAARWRR
jgi:predicted branched-subunit amino acid permease